MKQASAEEVLTQINQLHYHHILSCCEHVKRILKVGVAFCGKNIVCVSQSE